MQKVAFFDIDGTVFRSSLFIELVEGCIRAGVFPKEARQEYARAHTLWLNREGTYEAYIGSVIESFMKHIRGVYYGDFVDIGRSIVRQQGKRTYRYTRDLIAKLRSEGYFVVAISMSPKTILDEFCAGHGFDKVYGRLYELGPRDLFTGDVSDGDAVADKSDVVRRVIEKEKCTPVGSIGVGDTESDIPLLKSVEVPICFNPNQVLYRHALKHGWKVVVERKDVIYTL